ncbi:hypothetical protein DMUE_2771 [Dictyocoela muelleri]|nr:hypothetical protein DMUE_2771 [Dictyocoela muelleri]
MPGINCKIKENNIKINHLLYMDDAKLFAPDQDSLDDVFTIFKHLLKTLGYDLNLDKSYSNTEIQDLRKLEYKNTIKYLGIHENCLGKNTSITIEIVTNKIIERIEKLCKTNLNERKLFEAINQYAISVINYNIGILDLNEADLENINLKIRKTLTKL